MPIYTYECQSCNGTLDRRQSFSDDPLTTHDECGGDLKRVIYPAGIVFKGSGFYNTDYKNGSSSKRTDSSDTAKSESGATKSESTSEASASTNGSASTSDASSSSTATSSASSSSTPAPTTP